jgi:hypothetical protein
VRNGIWNQQVWKEIKVTDKIEVRSSQFSKGSKIAAHYEFTQGKQAKQEMIYRNLKILKEKGKE